MADEIEVQRCAWAGTDPDYVRYHDEEWGVPCHDDQHLFEMLCLEGAQAGLSWITVLKKRPHYRLLFKEFDPQQVADLSDEELERFLLDPGIIRNRLKVYGFRKNALAFLKVVEEFGSFDRYLWRFADGAPIINQIADMKQIPVSTPISDRMSKDLKKRGFTFVGTTICYAYMQAIGMVDDHVVECFRHTNNIKQD